MSQVISSHGIDLVFHETTGPNPQRALWQLMTCDKQFYFRNIAFLHRVLESRCWINNHMALKCRVNYFIYQFPNFNAAAVLYRALQL